MDLQSFSHSFILFLTENRSFLRWNRGDFLNLSVILSSGLYCIEKKIRSMALNLLSLIHNLICNSAPSFFSNWLYKKFCLIFHKCFFKFFSWHYDVSAWFVNCLKVELFFRSHCQLDRFENQRHTSSKDVVIQNYKFEFWRYNFDLTYAVISKNCIASDVP